MSVDLSAPWQVIEGDCLAVMPTLPEACVDAVVTDPPYGLAFMGKAWDHGVPGVAFWAEALRVAKPGAHLLAFGGTRTFHRLTCAIDDAGWEIRDCLSWLYGSGFPKSHNGPWGGTALKPAWEPIIMARKPLIGTVAANHAAHGTGALNIDGCRIAYETTQNPATNPLYRKQAGYANGAASDLAPTSYTVRSEPSERNPHDGGRWPANVVLDEAAARLLDAQSGALGFSSGTEVQGEAHPSGIYGSRQKEGRGEIGYGDSGGASRFFYTAKASRREREAGLREAGRSDGREKPIDNAYLRMSPVRNTHPTVKPVALMRWLLRLVTPAGGLVLDPFAGSGTTGVASAEEGFRSLLIEREPEYVKISMGRVAHAHGSAKLPLGDPA